jgi:hypothetical protein
MEVMMSSSNLMDRFQNVNPYNPINLNLISRTNVSIRYEI